MSDLFISYSRRDKKLVTEVVEHLDSHKSEGDQIFWDWKIPFGEHWWRQILDQIQGCTHFVFFLSQNSLRSEACNKELEWAKTANKIIIPINIDQHLRNSDLSQFKENIIPFQNSGKDYANRIIYAVTQRPAGRLLPGNIMELPRPSQPTHPLSSVASLYYKIKRSETIYDNEIQAAINTLRRKSRDPEYREEALQLMKQFLETELAGEPRQDIEDIIRARETNKAGSAPTKMNTAIEDASERFLSLPPETNTNLIAAALPKSIDEFAAFTAGISRILDTSELDLKEIADAFSIDTPTYSSRVIASELATDSELLNRIIETDQSTYGELANRLYNYCLDFLSRSRSGDRILA